MGRGGYGGGGGGGHMNPGFYGSGSCPLEQRCSLTVLIYAIRLKPTLILNDAFAVIPYIGSLTSCTKN
jgi:hypothetical protein